jgi:hypothetical protein
MGQNTQYVKDLCHQARGGLAGSLGLSGGVWWWKNSGLESLGPLALSQSNARPSSILIYELNAGCFKSPPNSLKSGTARLARPGLQLMHGHNSNPRFVR